MGFSLSKSNFSPNPRVLWRVEFVFQLLLQKFFVSFDNKMLNLAQTFACCSEKSEFCVVCFKQLILGTQQQKGYYF